MLSLNIQIIVFWCKEDSNPWLSITIICCHVFQVFLGSHGFFGEDGEQMKADRAVGREDYGRPQCPTPGDWCLKRVLRKTFFPWSLFGANLRRDSVAPLPKQVRKLGTAHKWRHLHFTMYTPVSMFCFSLLMFFNSSLDCRQLRAFLRIAVIKICSVFRQCR